MDMVIFILTEVRDKYHMISLICRILKKKKKIQMNLFTRQKQNHRLRKQTSGDQNVKVRGTDKSGV